MFNDVYRDSGRGAFKIFSSKLKNDNNRSVGTFYNRGRLQIGISSKICMNRRHENHNISQNADIFYAEINSLLEKDAIEKVFFRNLSQIFTVHYFWYQRKTGK